MAQDKGHLKSEFGNSVADIVRNVEDAREKNDARLTLGFALLMGCFFLPPIAPPKVVLPLMDVVLATTVLVGRKKHQQIENEFAKSYEALDATQKLKLLPLKKVLIDQKAPSLGESFNPVTNWKRVLWSASGGVILNPMLIPAIYSGILHNDEFKKNSDLRQATHAIATKEKLELVV